MADKDINNLSYREFLELKRQVSKASDYFQMSFVDVSKRFLTNFFEEDIYALDFDSLRTNFPSLFIEPDEAALSEQDFYIRFAKKTLGLVDEPRKVFVDTMSKVIEDLQSLDANLIYIQEELNRLNQIKITAGRLNGEERYYKNQLEFYRERNLEAKQEVVRFLADRSQDYIINSANKSYFRKFWPDALPYKFSSAKAFSAVPNSYDVKALNNMSNKFMEMSIRQKAKCEALYHSDPSAFFEFAKGYIAGPDGELDRIRGLITQSHILNRRKKILETLLEHYMRQDYLSFINMAPLQVEGIFHDICLEVGVKQAELDISSLNLKLSKLGAVLGYSLNYEYYAFKFPVIRNAVAHGELIEDGLEHAAMMLMLDLGPVCSLTLDEHIPLMKSISLIQKFADTKDYNLLLAWFSLRNIPIPEFYGLADRFSLITSAYESDDFWNFIDEQLRQEADFNGSQLVGFISRMKSSGLAAAKCQQALSSMGKIKKEKDQQAMELRVTLIKDVLHGGED